MLPLTAALMLTLDTQATPPQPIFITIERKSTEHEVVVEAPDHPPPKRSTAWVMAGGLGMASIGAGMAAVISQAQSRVTSRLGDVKDTKAGNRAMAVGALIGLLPGLIFGREARRE